MSDLRSAMERFAREEVCPVGDHCIPGFVSGAFHGWGEARNRIAAILRAHPTKQAASLPQDAVALYRDGNQWCCVGLDFINLQESDAGFGDTADQAIEQLATIRAKKAGTLPYLIAGGDVVGA